MHRLLIRQLARLGLTPDAAPSAELWRALLERIDTTYTQTDQERYTQERSMAISSEELHEAAVKSKAAAHAKSLFLAKMSHEIRTPMTAIMGHVDLLTDPMHSATERAESINNIRRNADHLIGVINDILDVSKIEEGKMTIERREVCPLKLVEESISMLRARAKEKQLVLSLDYCYPLPARISVDPLRFRQIILNLVGNAIKFTQKGEVSVAVKFRAVTGDTQSPLRGGDLLVCITDTGIGLSPEQIERLFANFVQADDSMTRRFGGTGLGLAISRSLARLMDGDITVERRVENGSVFTFVLRLSPELCGEMRHSGEPEITPHQSLPPPPPSQPLMNRRILLVEDGLDNQRLVSLFLRRAGAEVTVADNGAQGVQTALAAFHSKQQFDLILMDMQMPILDGPDATAKLRAAGFGMPIIALTANTSAQDRERCMKAGSDEFLTKPINRGALIAVCASFINKQGKRLMPREKLRLWAP